MRAVALAGLALLLSGCAALSDSADTPYASAPLNEWMPQVAIVFPLLPPGATKPTQSYAANVSVWPTNRVLCAKPASPAVELYFAKNDDPGQLVTAPPHIQQRTDHGTAFPSAEFDGVAANRAADPTASYSLVAFVDGQPASNVWLHGSGHPLAYGPVQPTGYASPNPTAFDTRIQIVFPHDDQGKAAAVDKASLLNIAVDVFQHGTTLSVPPDADLRPTLWLAQGNDPLEPQRLGVQRTTYSVGGQGYPRWVFNDVPVQPGGTYHFLAMVGSLGQDGGSYPSIWTHSPAGDTVNPKPQTPPSCIP